MFNVGSNSASKTIYVAFAWADTAAVPVPIAANQTVREAVTPYLPSAQAGSSIGVIDLEGVDVTDRRGADIPDNARVIVNTTGFAKGGVKALCVRVNWRQSMR